MVAFPIVMFGAVTWATTDCKLFGVWKPAGVVRPIVVSPDVSGLKAVSKFSVSPALNTAGLPTMVPTFVSELVTGTCTVSPPRSGCDVT
jgi:hypothetical protein